MFGTYGFSLIAMDLITHLNALMVVREGVMPPATGLLHHALCCPLVFICLLLLKDMPEHA